MKIEEVTARTRVVDRKTGEMGTIVDVRPSGSVSLITDSGIAFSGLGVVFVCKRWRLATDTGDDLIDQFWNADE